MAKSLAQKKSDKKKRGEKVYKRIREKTYNKGRAPHCANPARLDGKISAMLVLNPPTELLGIDLEDWHREGARDVVRAKCRFACGCEVQREAVMEYGPHEREDILYAMLSPVTPDE